ncbi:ArsC/Spx/MgsR family protein [Bradyrhizobium sp. ERR14]|uniref:ArsC/Spx/MgsR family protein n=1 Tax=Bradyrhizobium sp. ERR14 TaxID=2663837 RepID=UPI00185A85DA|nr:ArsC/Spx/MgsR family protein [Bradyrhizobium sp. ERR14]MBB4397106.1 nitrogenase-associated protein [Bradyrhizobium sp. ERR14]
MLLFSQVERFEKREYAGRAQNLADQRRVLQIQYSAWCADIGNDRARNSNWLTKAAAPCQSFSSARSHRYVVATIIFYQKLGCATNARRIQALKSAGHDVIAQDILNKPWDAEELREFFGNMPVEAWFNRAAPRIKSGEVNLDTIDAASALALMVGDPLLIRRPLIDVDGARFAGLGHEPVLSLLGRNTQDNLEECFHEANRTRCPQT